VNSRQKIFVLGLISFTVLIVIGFFEAVMTGDDYLMAELSFVYVVFLIAVNLFGPRIRKWTKANPSPER
jgi:hypothetical protein